MCLRLYELIHTNVNTNFLYYNGLDQGFVEYRWPAAPFHIYYCHVIHQHDLMRPYAYIYVKYVLAMHFTPHKHRFNILDVRVQYLPAWWLIDYTYDVPHDCRLGMPNHAP